MSGGARRLATWAFIAAFGVELGCAQRQAWQHDESGRIDEVMSSKKFPDDVAALGGTPFAAPPSTAPPLAKSTYEIQNAPPKKRTKPRHNSRSGSKRRGRREEEITSPAAGENSVSRRP